LIFTALAELSTRAIAESEQATGMPKNKVAAKEGRRHREEGAAGTGAAHGEVGGVWEQFSATEEERLEEVIG